MNQHSLITYNTILAAKQGDPDAMNAILQHYDRYISKYAHRIHIDEQGNRHTYIDEDIKNGIHMKLMIKIISDFDIDSLPPGETLED